MKQEKKQAEEEAQDRASKQLAVEAAQAEKARDLSNEVSKCKTLSFIKVVYLFQGIDESFACVFSCMRLIRSLRNLGR